MDFIALALAKKYANDIKPEISDKQISTNVENWLNDHPEATTTVPVGGITTSKLADKAVTLDKVDETIQRAVSFLGSQEIYWEIGYKLTANGLAKHSYGAVSSLVYFKAGDTFAVSESGGVAFRYAYYGEDGATYTADGSNIAGWSRSTVSLLYDGYYRFWIECSPTSTTVLTEENLPNLLALFNLKSSALLGLDGSTIQDKTIPLSKLGADCYTPILEQESIFRQAAIGGISFSKGIIPSATNKGIKKDKFTTLFADMYNMRTTAYPSSSVSFGVITMPASTGSDLAVSTRSDICVVKDELWVFGTAADDNSNYGTVWRLKYDPLTNNLCEDPKFFWHNWGHCNAVNYNPVTDTLILGNGSADYNLENAVYIIYNVSNIINAESGAVIDYKTHGIKIDMSDYDFGAKLNVFWTNTKTTSSNYSMNMEYLPNTAFAYADDVNKMYIIAFGTGANKYPNGTYVEPSGDLIWNGTYSVLCSYQVGDADETIGNPGSYEHCGQGGDAIEGTAFIGLGHGPFWWTEVSPTSATKADKRDKWYPSFNYSTGVLNNDKVEGIAVTNDYLIIMATGNIHYIPK